MIARLKKEFSEVKKLNKNKNAISFNNFSKLLVKDLRKFYMAGKVVDVSVHPNLKIITININYNKKIAVYYNNIFDKLDVELVMYKNDAVSYSKRYPINSVDDFNSIINNVIQQINIIAA